MDELYGEEKAKAQQQRDTAVAYEEVLCAALRRMSGARDGLEFLRWLLTVCGTLRAEYPLDHARAAWDAGRRDVGVQIMALARKAGVLEQIIREDAKV